MTTMQIRALIVVAILAIGLAAFLACLAAADNIIDVRVITQRDVDDAIGGFIRDARSDFERGGA
jgi:hypothetical protein